MDDVDARRQGRGEADRHEGGPEGVEVAVVVAVRHEAQRQGHQRQDQGPSVEIGDGAPLAEADARHPVVEVLGVGAVDRAPVLEPLGDDEARVEDRNGEDRQREEEGDHGVRLQRSLNGDHRHQVAEQVRPGVPHEARRRREAVAQEAEGGAGSDRGEHAGGVAVQRERDHRQRRRGDQADAGGQAIDAVDQIDDVGDGDDPDHGQQLAQVDRADSRRVEELHRRRIDAAEEREREGGHGDPGRDRDDRRRRLAEQLDPGWEVDQIVDHPHRRDHDRPGEDRARLMVPGQEDRAADQHRHQDGEPAQLRGRVLVQAALVWEVDRPVSDAAG